MYTYLVLVRAQFQEINTLSINIKTRIKSYGSQFGLSGSFGRSAKFPIDLIKRIYKNCYKYIRAEIGLKIITGVIVVIVRIVRVV